MRKLRKILCFIIAFAMILPLAAVSALADNTGDTTTAALSTSKFTVNGKTKAFTAYTINGSNYVKLRDVAMALNGTAKTFSVDWDAELNAIDLTTDKAYKPIGGELAGARAAASASATASTSSVYIDSWESVIMAFTISKSNYFRLRDLAAVLNFGLAWNGAANAVAVDTTVGYDSDENSSAGGPVAEIVGAWSGYFFDGKWGTIYFYWNATFAEGYGDPSNSDFKQYDSGTFSLSGDQMTVIYADGRTGTFTYGVSLMDDSVSLELAYQNNNITLFKH